MNSSPDVEPDVETSAPANEDHDESHHRFGSDQDQDDGNDPNVLTPPRQVNVKDKGKKKTEKP